MDESLAGLRAFVALADAGSFSQAARRMGVSRPAVSRAVARLEARHGVRLVERGNRHVALTAAGLLLLGRARLALDALAAAEDLLVGDTALVRGTVRMDVPPAFGRRWVLPVVAALTTGHPGLQVDLRFSRRAGELVADGTDLALRIGRVGDSAELIGRQIGWQPTLLCAAPEWLAAHGDVSTPDALPRRHCIVEASEERWTWLGVPLQGDAPALVLRDSQAALEAALAAYGIALLPEWMAQPHLQAGVLVRVLPGCDGPRLPIHLLWPVGRFLPQRVRVVIDALVDAVGTQGRMMV